MHYLEIAISSLVFCSIFFFLGSVFEKAKLMSFLDKIKHGTELLSNKSEEYIKAYIQAIKDIQFKL